MCELDSSGCASHDAELETRKGLRRTVMNTEIATRYRVVRFKQLRTQLICSYTQSLGC
jgi:hypothetical protein